MTNPLLTPAEAGEQLGLTPAALAQLRYTGSGPCFVKPLPTVGSTGGRCPRREHSGVAAGSSTSGRASLTATTDWSSTSTEASVPTTSSTSRGSRTKRRKAIFPCGAFLQVDLRNSTWMSGAANNADLVNVNGWQTLRQVAAESFEGYTTVGIGVRAQLPFRVFTLNGPGAGSRLVVDVANYW